MVKEQCNLYNPAFDSAPRVLEECSEAAWVPRPGLGSACLRGILELAGLLMRQLLLHFQEFLEPEYVTWAV